MKYRCCLLLLAWSLCPAQERPMPIDSLLAALSKSREDSAKVNLMNRISQAYQKTDSVKGMAYAEKALQLAEKLNWREGISKAHYRIATQYKTNFNYGKALYYYRKSLSETKDKRLMSKVYTNLGNIMMYESRYSQALDNYHRALKIDESLGDRNGIANMTMNIGSVYYSIKDYKKSIAYFNKSLAQKTTEPVFNAMLLRNIAAAYNMTGQTKKALDYFEKSLGLYESFGDREAQSSLLSDIALTHYDLEDYDKAIRYSKRSLEMAPEGIEDKINLAFSFGIIGDSYTEKARTAGKKTVMLDSAMFYLGKSIALHQELGNIRGLFDDYSSLTTAQKLRGDFSRALESYEKAMVYKDSIFNSDNRETIKNIEDKRAIEIRDRELKINRITLEAEKRQQWFLILGIVLLLIIGAMLFYQSNNRKKTNRKLNRMNADLDRANNIKTRLLGILNHDLRSPMNSFIHFIQFQRESPEALDAETKKRIEDATIDSAKNLLESMEDMLLWTKDQMDNFEPQLKNFAVEAVFDDLKKLFANVRHVAIVFENPENLEVFADEDYLKTILRNLISNAVKALEETPDGKVLISAGKQNGNAFIVVSDNGPGGNDEQFRALRDQKVISGVKSGLGLHLVRDLAKAIGWSVTIDSMVGKGTSITLSQ